MPSWLGPWEIVIIVVIVLLIFGGSLLPKMGSKLGRSLKGLKKGVQEGSEEFRSAIKEEDEAGKSNDTGKSDQS